jgi:hypothetical protein
MSHQILDKSHGFVIIHASDPIYPYYVRAVVLISRDARTGEMEVRGNIYTAPDDHIPITSPYADFRHGYLTKTAARKLAMEVKRDLVAWAKDGAVKFTEPIEMRDPWR